MPWEESIVASPAVVDVVADVVVVGVGPVPLRPRRRLRLRPDSYVYSPVFPSVLCELSPP